MARGFPEDEGWIWFRVRMPLHGELFNDALCWLLVALGHFSFKGAGGKAIGSSCKLWCCSAVSSRVWPASVYRATSIYPPPPGAFLPAREALEDGVGMLCCYYTPSPCSSCWQVLQKIAEDVKGVNIDVVFYVDRLDLYRVDPLDTAVRCTEMYWYIVPSSKHCP